MDFIIEQLKQKINDYKEALKKEEDTLKEFKEDYANRKANYLEQAIKSRETNVNDLKNMIIKLTKALEVLEE